MKTTALTTNPNLMTVICNIQLIREKLDSTYNKFTDFRNLEKMTESELYETQEYLINQYNESLKHSTNAVNKDNAMSANNFTHRSMTNKDKTPLRVRRNGKTQVWKTRPNDFRIPVKYGLYEYYNITQDNCHEWNIAD